MRSIFVVKSKDFNWKDIYVGKDSKKTHREILRQYQRNLYVLEIEKGINLNVMFVW